MTNLSNIFGLFLSLILHSMNSATLPVVEVMLNNRAYLPCNISSLGDIDDVTLILWFKENVTQPLYSIDARNGHINQGKRFSGPELGKRGYFILNSQPPSLRIDPVESTDSGVYRCRIDSKSSRTMNIDMFVRVVVPPSKPRIKDKFGNYVEGLAGPYNEGEPLVLVCESRGGMPYPNVTWWKDKKMEDDTYRVMSGNVVKNDLMISSLQRSYLHAKLKCTARNNNLQPPPSTSIVLDINFRPLVIELQKISPLSASKVYNITCKVIGSRPKIKVSWFSTNSLLNVKETVVVKSDFSFTSFLLFKPKSNDDKKSLKCKAENPLISDSAIEDEVILHVNYKPEMSLMANGKSTLEPILEGSEVFMECTAKGSPPPGKATWKFNGKTLGNFSTQNNTMMNYSLYIKSASLSDQGSYSCVAENTEGISESNEIILKLLHAPMCKEPKEIVFAFGRNREGRLECEVQAEPPDVEFSWWFNNSLEGIVRQLTQFSAEGTFSNLVFTPKGTADYGYYYCSATNDVGAQQHPCIFRVISIAGAPEAVKNCSLSKRNKETLQVDCAVGYDGGAIQYFVMEVYNSDTEELVANVSSSVPSLNVKNVPTNMPVRLVIYAYNSRGKSPTLSLHSNTVVVNSTDSALLRAITPALAILIGIVAGLVLVTSLVLLMVKIKWHLRRTRNVKMGNDSSNKSIGEELSETHDSAENSEGKSPDIIPSNRKTVNVNVIHREDDETTKCLNHVPEGVCRAGDLVNISHRDWGPPQNTNRRNIGYQELAVIYPSYDGTDDHINRNDLIPPSMYSLVSDERSRLVNVPSKHSTFTTPPPPPPPVPEVNVGLPNSEEDSSRTCCASQKLSRRGIESTV